MECCDRGSEKAILSDDWIVLTENIASSAVHVFAQAGLENVSHFSHALGLRDAESTATATVLGIGSRTQVTAALLDALPDLSAGGCFSVGTNKVDLEMARARGLQVFTQGRIC